MDYRQSWDASQDDKGDRKLMLNPGYKTHVSDDDFRQQIEPGPVLFCPKCQKPIMEAVAERVYTRCKHCRRWVYMQKTLDKIE